MYDKFPDNFIWGTATASYQVEGAYNIDGKGLNIWDKFTHEPGNIKNDNNGDTAVDQYHKYKEDVQLLKWLGVKAYRFSISWSRIFPDGRGKVNEEGVKYYHNLIDELLKYNIAPWITLFHWDLPLALDEQFGGWESKETCKFFSDYAGFIIKTYSDKVKNFMTINEFINFTDLAYGSGYFAPGKQIGIKRLNQLRHNALLSHGMAVIAMRANEKQKLNIGIADCPKICCPAIETEENIKASKLAFKQLNAQFLTAVLDGKYNEKFLLENKENIWSWTEQEMKIINEPLDFVGINIYYPVYIIADSSEDGFKVIDHPESYPKMDTFWLYIGPQIAYWGPRLLKDIWNIKSIYITENGAACKDKLTKNNEVYDTDRVMYLREHFNSMLKAIKEEIPLKGYFLWTLLDNFEWTEGFSKRFGIFYVNYNKNLERIPKLSAHFYKEVIKNNIII